MVKVREHVLVKLSSGTIRETINGMISKRLFPQGNQEPSSIRPSTDQVFQYSQRTFERFLKITSQ